MGLDIRPATRASLREFYGRDIPVTTRAWTLHYAGQMVGVGGYYLLPRTKLVYTDLRDGVPKVVIMRAARALMDRIQPPAMALCERPRARRLLTRLGWRDTGEGVFEWSS